MLGIQVGIPDKHKKPHLNTESERHMFQPVVMQLCPSNCKALSPLYPSGVGSNKMSFLFPISQLEKNKSQPVLI